MSLDVSPAATIFFVIYSAWASIAYGNEELRKSSLRNRGRCYLIAQLGPAILFCEVSRRKTIHDGQKIIASDISPQMLAIAQKKLVAAKFSIEFRQLDACSITGLSDESVDLYSISLGLKICDRKKVLREALRVLRPGGRLVVLKSSNIPWQWLYRVYCLYMNWCVPVIGWIATRGDASAYKYLLRGMENFPTAEEFAKELNTLGFGDISFERLTLGIVAIHTARKPEPTGSDSHHTA